jgi:hypothetical protein
MLTPLSQWILIATLSQAPAEAAFSRAAPADVDVAVRVRGLEATRDELLAMIKAMNPEWGNMAEAHLGAPVGEIRARHGARAVKSPFLALLRFDEPGGDGGPPPFAILVPSDDYKGTLKEFSSGNDVELKHQEGNYDAFDGPGGHGTWYAAQVPGVVAFGTSKGLIADIAKRPAKTLDSVLTGSAAKSFTGGDIGAYVNAASLTKRYADQIEQGRQIFMGAIDQATQQAGNAGAMQFAKDFYSGLFDSLKYADGLTLNLDFAEKGLHLAGFLKVKPDSDALKSISEVRTGEIAALGNLPPGATVYVYMNVAAKTFDRLQGMNLKMLGGAGKPSPDLEKAMAELHGLGRIESLGTASMDKGMVAINDIKTEDPKRFIEKSLAILRAMSGGEGQSGLFKDVKVEPAAQTLRGLTFTQASATVNMDKLAEISGNNPAQLESMKAIFGDGRMNYWYGTDGKRLLQVVAPKWEDAKTLIDDYLKGAGDVGQATGFKAVLSELPGRASFLMLFSTQGLVRILANQFATLSKNPNLKAPDDMPKEPAYLGVSLTPHPSEGYELHLVIPSPVGAVVAKGMVPLFQAIGGAGANQ